MAFFLDREAGEASLDGSDHEGYLSDEIPMTNYKRRGAHISSTSSEHESELDEDVRLVGLPVHKKKRKKKSANQSDRNDHEDPLLEELKKTNSMMLGLVKKVKSTEQRMKVIEEKMKCDTTPKRLRRKAVPDAVRVSLVGSYL